MRRRPIVTLVAAVLAAAIVAAGCSEEINTAEVDGSGPSSSTTVARNGSERAVSSRGASPAPTAPASKVAGASESAADSPQAQAALDLITKIAQDPAGFAQANGLTQEQIAKQLGVSPSVLQQLQVNPGTVSAIANVLTRLNPATLGDIANGKVNPALVSTVISLFGLVNPQAAAGLGGLDPRALSVLATAAGGLDPKIIQAVGNVLSVADPNGLGKLSGDKNSLGLLTVLFAVALRTDPAQFQKLGALNNLSPGFQFALSGITSIVNAFDPKTVKFINEISTNFSPQLIATLSGIVVSLDRPEIKEVLNNASQHPEDIATAIGVAALLIPGLAGVIDPATFANNPNATNQVLLSLLLLALARANGIDVSQLAGK